MSGPQRELRDAEGLGILRTATRLCHPSPRGARPCLAALLYLCSRSGQSASAYRAVQRLSVRDALGSGCPSLRLRLPHRSPQRSLHRPPSTAVRTRAAPSLPLTSFLYSKPGNRCKQPWGLCEVTLQGWVCAVQRIHHLGFHLNCSLGTSPILRWLLIQVDPGMWQILK